MKIKKKMSICFWLLISYVDMLQIGRAHSAESTSIIKPGEKKKWWIDGHDDFPSIEYMLDVVAEYAPTEASAKVKWMLWVCISMHQPRAEMRYWQGSQQFIVECEKIKRTTTTVQTESERRKRCVQKSILQ